jgi:hypothetical protein
MAEPAVMVEPAGQLVAAYHRDWISFQLPPRQSKMTKDAPFERES